MGKTRAEIQKDYRERKKLKDGERYLIKESSRVKKYYVSSSCLTEKERKKRNKVAAERNGKHRRLLQERARLRQEEDDSDEGEETSGYESSRLIVKLPLQTPNQLHKKKKRTAKALMRSNRKCKKTEEKVMQLHKKCKKNQKTIERLRAKLRRIKSPVKASTPKSKTNSLMNSLNLTPIRAKTVKRQIFLGNVLLDQISRTKTDKSQKCAALRVLAGRVTKKYRCLNILRKASNLACSRTMSKYANQKFKAQKVVTRKCQREVTVFFERSDNSRTNPGKKDSKKIDGEKRQTKVLTDYLSNLYRKFIAENPTYCLSLATFCRLRPKHVLPVKFTSRQSCLCIRHQNAALKMQALRRIGVSVSENPEVEVNLEERLDELFTNIDVDKEINFDVWKRVEIAGFKKMKVVNESKLKGDFLIELKGELSEFRSHVKRMKEQFSQIKHLKEQLPENQIIIQMDFAENYTCRSVDEIQSAYWNQTSVTIHPMVVYFRKEGELHHKSFVLISDELAHNANTVWAILDILVPELRRIIDPNLKLIHYWTDSPSSQYRNKYIFNIVSNHHELYGVNARWNYFEAGHGKGPCDGLGGTTKRLADEAIRMKAAVIQDASDFFVWASNSTMKEVNFLWLGKEACREKQDAAASLKLKSIKGTMKYHAVASIDPKTLWARDCSCYCTICLTGDICGSWNSHSTGVGAVADKATNIEQSEEDATQTQPITICAEGQFVACVYENGWYIGKVLQIDENEVEVSFMVESKGSYKWPNNPDEIWVNYSDVLTKITEPTPNGKSGRFYKLLQVDKDTIEIRFKNHTSEK